MKKYILLAMLGLLNGCSEIIQPYNQVMGDMDHNRYRDSNGFVYEGKPLYKLNIRSGWIVDQINVDNMGIMGSAIGGMGGSMHYYSLKRLKRVIVHKGWFDGQKAVTNITFIYIDGHREYAGTMQGTQDNTKIVYNVQGKYLASYKALSHGRYLNDIRFKFVKDNSSMHGWEQ